MYSMFASIHRIYSSVTLTFFFLNVFSRVAILPSESVASTGMAFSPVEDRLGLLQFTARADHSGGARRMKKVSFC